MSSFMFSLDFWKYKVIDAWLRMVPTAATEGQPASRHRDTQTASSSRGLSGPRGTALAPRERRGPAWRWEPQRRAFQAPQPSGPGEEGAHGSEGSRARRRVVFTNSLGGGAGVAGAQAPEIHHPQGCAAPFAVTESKAKTKTGTRR